jgi:hypothetical protein
MSMTSVRKQNALFDEALSKIQADQEAREKREREAPRQNFLRRAKSVGFTEKQAEFLHNELATRRHEHWNGRVG